MQEFAELLHVPRFERLFAAISQRLDEIEVLADLRLPGPRSDVLVVKDAAGGPVVAGEEEQQIVFEIDTKLL